MLIHPWDAALDPGEWQDWVASTDRFGMLVVNNRDRAQAPLALPTHFTVTGDEQRSSGLDAGAATQQRRRLTAIGDWQTHRSKP